MSPRIAIVGAGLCGLTISRLLECRGIDFALFEKGEEDKHLKCGGGSVDIYKDTGQQALREANLLDEFLKSANLGDDRLAIYDRHGKKWAEVGGDDEHLGQGPLQIDQLVLRRMLLQSLPKGKIHWGHRVSCVELGAKAKPVLKFANGSTAAGFDLVVGADGIWSRVRQSVSKRRHSIHFLRPNNDR
jgi:2-polyprenyl-6-methoxyphenol hydroxylase-like FAD-dependent oxidoreductase